MVRVLIVADDLTGAMDAAVPFARRGLRVQVFNDFTKYDRGLHKGDVLSVSTNSRHLPPELAAAKVTELTRDFRPSFPDLLIKKIDSTLRGNVVVESEALLHTSGKRRAVVCPAIPDQGRTMSGGVVHLDGVALQDTFVGHDLRAAPATGTLAEQFRSNSSGWRVREEKSEISYASGNSTPEVLIRIADAESNRDLCDLVRGCKQDIGEYLFIGASGLTEALAETLFGPTQKTRGGTMGKSGRVVFILGSTAPETAAQLDNLLRSTYDVAHIMLSPAVIENGSAVLDGVQIASQTAGQDAVALVAPPLSETSGLDPEQVVDRLAATAGLVMQSASTGLLVATGGDTVQAVLETLDVACLDVRGEIQPGVVLGTIETAGGRFDLVTKAGGFGKADLFLKIMEFHRLNVR